MSIAVLAPSPARARIGPHRWTCDEFHSMGDHSLFENLKLILVDGEILEMPAPNPAHSTSLGLVDEWLRVAFGTGFWVRPQLALVFDINTDPVPDLAVVPGRPMDYEVHPSTALLVVEVAQHTSLPYDTGVKASLYAAAGIADYWVVDLEGRRVLVYRDPRPDPSQHYGHGYASVVARGPTDTLTPLASPAVTVTAGDLLP